MWVSPTDMFQLLKPLRSSDTDAIRRSIFDPEKNLLIKSETSELILASRYKEVYRHSAIKPMCQGVKAGSGR